MAEKRKEKTLVVLLGPTGVGKTDLSIRLATRFSTAIVSCDSRQVYREMTIGTAVPEKEQLEAVPHFFIQTRPAASYYSCWEFEQQALGVLDSLFADQDVVVMSGGSMLYIDAVCRGMDDIPTVDAGVRQEVSDRFRQEGIESIRRQLKQLDPVFYGEVDLKNGKRLMHAVEICLTTGRPYSSFRTGVRKERPFRVIKIGLRREMPELYERINGRVEEMMRRGLLEEARTGYPYREYNAWNTVGYKELFEYFDGATDLPEAVRRIQRNTRRYAKKQLTWFRRDPSVAWFHPDAQEAILKYLSEAGVG